MKIATRLAALAASTALALCAFAAPAFAATLEAGHSYDVQASLDCTVKKGVINQNFADGIITKATVDLDKDSNKTLTLELGESSGTLFGKSYTAWLSDTKNGETVAPAYQDAESNWQNASYAMSTEEGKTNHVEAMTFPISDESTYQLRLFIDNAFTPTIFGGADSTYPATLTIDWNTAKKYLAESDATLSATSFTYNGTAKKPAVTINGLTEGTDFTVDYASNVNAGTAVATITGMGSYTGKVDLLFTIKKASQKLTLSAAKKTVKRGKYAYPITVKGAKGTKMFKKASGSKYLTVASNGKITLSKKAKKGKTYSVKVKVYAKANANYNASSNKYITVKVKAK